MPVAARLNELGITAFSLNYHTSAPAYAETGLMPLPVEDVARAIRFIEDHFGFPSHRIAVGGFSAGGHLAGMWGAHYRDYGLLKPPALLLDYPLVSLENVSPPAKELFAAGWVDRAVAWMTSEKGTDA